MSPSATVLTRISNGATGVAQAKAPTANVSFEVEVTTIVARRELPKSLGAVKHKALACWRDRNIEEAITDKKYSLQLATSKAEQSVEECEARERDVGDAWREFQQAQVEVDDKIDAELHAAKAYGKLLAKRRSRDAHLQRMRNELAQRKKVLAVMEFMQANQEKMKAIQGRKKQAEDELQIFLQQQKDMKLEQRRLEKEALQTPVKRARPKHLSDACAGEPSEKRHAGVKRLDRNLSEETLRDEAEKTEVDTIEDPSMEDV